MSNKLTINVIDSKQLKPMLNEVTSLVAGAIRNTFGPYGHSTLIQTLDSVYSTKDGWNVARNLRISASTGEYSAAVNAIKKLVLDVAQSVVLNAGDGTSTVILAADVLNKKVTKHLSDLGLDSRTVENALNECVKMINTQLLRDAKHVTDENMDEIIHRIALISTNWDEEVADLIRDIYVKTKNPIIKVEDSGNQNTYAEYIKGYDLNAELQLPNYFINNMEEASFEADNPYVLIFAAPLGKKHAVPLCTLGQMVGDHPLVILAPNFDIDFLSILNNMTAEFEARGQKLNVVPCRFFANSAIDKDCVADFAALLGTTVLSTQYDKLYNALTELGNKNAELKSLLKEDAEKSTSSLKRSADEKSATKKKIIELNKENKDCIEHAADELKELYGTCEHLKINSKYVLATGLMTESDDFKRRKANLESLLELKYKQYNAESSMTEAIRSMRIRLGKMECNMATIKVGGFGKAHITSRKDAIDDATRACEVAYTGGYILDGGLAIAKAAHKCFITQKTNTDIDVYLNMFTEAFSEVCADMYNNKYNNISKSKSLVDQCIGELSSPSGVRDVAYNLITEKFDEESLITPVNVCTEVVSACLRLVLVNCTSNQFVFQTEDSLIRSIKEGSEINDIINEASKDDAEYDD